MLAALAGVTATLEASRTYPFGIEQLPSVNVLTGEETIEPDEDTLGGAYPNQVRSLAIDLECRVAVESTTVIDDALDSLAYDIEQALSATPNLGGVVDVWRYDGAADVELSDEFESPVALRTIGYLATYRVDVRDPT